MPQDSSHAANTPPRGKLYALRQATAASGFLAYLHLQLLRSGAQRGVGGAVVGLPRRPSCPATKENSAAPRSGATAAALGTDAARMLRQLTGCDAILQRPLMKSGG